MPAPLTFDLSVASRGGRAYVTVSGDLDSLTDRRLVPGDVGQSTVDWELPAGGAPGS